MTDAAEGNRDAPSETDSYSGRSIGDMVRGLIYTHNRANANTAVLHETSAELNAVVELLIQRGVLDADALAKHRMTAAEDLKREYFERGMGVAIQEFKGSKYTFGETPAIDCENRVDFCMAACCKLGFALSKEDIQEGVIRWDLGRPYLIAQGPDHQCVHLNRQTRSCGVYANRPIPCRGYDCRQDTRIWLDFEKRIVNPALANPDWPGCLEPSDGEDARA